MKLYLRFKMPSKKEKSQIRPKRKERERKMEVNLTIASQDSKHKNLDINNFYEINLQIFKNYYKNIIFIEN